MTRVNDIITTTPEQLDDMRLALLDYLQGRRVSEAKAFTLLGYASSHYVGGVARGHHKLREIFLWRLRRHYAPLAQAWDAILGIEPSPSVKPAPRPIEAAPAPEKTLDAPHRASLEWIAREVKQISEKLDRLMG